MNLVRLGHFFTPVDAAKTEGEEVNGLCQTALVVAVWSDTLVNAVVWSNNGSQFTKTSLPVEAPSGRESFHLSGDCPWLR